MVKALEKKSSHHNIETRWSRNFKRGWPARVLERQNKKFDHLGYIYTKTMRVFIKGFASLDQPSGPHDL